MATPTNLPASFVSGAILTAAQQNDLRGAFRVLQVVSDTNTATVSVPTTAYVSTGLSASITPQATTNKILVFVNVADCYKATDAAGNGLNFQLWKGASSIAQLGQDFLRTDDTQRQHGQFDAFYLDSPATTSATTYTVYAANRTTGTCQTNFNASVSSLILVEISA
jgi:hypothetical protein